MTSQPDIRAYIAGLPKAELHVHMQGAASVETVLGLSRRYPEVGLPQDESGDAGLLPVHRLRQLHRGVCRGCAAGAHRRRRVRPRARPRTRPRDRQRALRGGDRHCRQPPRGGHRAGRAVGRAHARTRRCDVTLRRRARVGVRHRRGVRAVVRRTAAVLVHVLPPGGERGLRHRRPRGRRAESRVRRPLPAAPRSSASTASRTRARRSVRRRSGAASTCSVPSASGTGSRLPRTPG